MLPNQSGSILCSSSCRNMHQYMLLTE